MEKSWYEEPYINVVLTYLQHFLLHFYHFFAAEANKYQHHYSRNIASLPGPFEKLEKGSGIHCSRMHIMHEHLKCVEILL